MPDCSVDSVVTDPPYGFGDGKRAGFMGKRWDYDVPSVEIWAECLRVLKPGGHLLAFAGTRTQHRMAVRIEDAGFEIRDMIAWVYGSGMPKSLDVSKAIDKAAGAEREVVGYDVSRARPNRTGKVMGEVEYNRSDNGATITAPATPEAQQWAGWGTAIKPSFEPVTMARKPLTGTVAANVLEHGTGALNIDGCRVGTGEARPHRELDAKPTVNNAYAGRMGKVSLAGGSKAVGTTTQGRWPANLIHDGSDEVVGLFPEANSARVGNPNNPHRGINHTATSYGQGDGKTTHDYRDTGSAARFFYQAKCSKADRGEGNGHPTVKPTDLMRYLCRLVTPPGGIVLDPFMGSGSTGKAAVLEGFSFIGIEREAAYYAIAQERVQAPKAKQLTLIH